MGWQSQKNEREEARQYEVEIAVAKQREPEWVPEERLVHGHQDPDNGKSGYDAFPERVQSIIQVSILTGSAGSG
jgi:hypothetical protein